MNFIGKRVLITGSSRGIGQATAKEFLQLGALVAINGRSKDTVEQAWLSLDKHENITKIVGDVSTVSGCQAIVEQAICSLGGLDVLVNAAGVGTSVSIAKTDEALWDAAMDINLKGTFFCCQAALPELKKSGGSIVNIASDCGLQGEKKLAAYCASKAGVVNMSKSMALDLAPDVRINCICPGYVDTDMVRRDCIDKASNPETVEQALKDYAPLKRFAAPLEIAKAVAYLASEYAVNITGTSLSIDGGTTA